MQTYTPYLRTTARILYTRLNVRWLWVGSGIGGGQEGDENREDSRDEKGREPWYSMLMRLADATSHAH